MTTVAIDGEDWLIAGARIEGLLRPVNNVAGALSRHASRGYFDPGEAAGGSHESVPSSTSSPR